ncbi:MAG: hypothetical protein JRM74_03065 [Nitrososphaerota archaeon]|nr:hypothetical protein [Nitrososphaerota archaeon]MDG6959176.1 hypothetical protein [Nitrososphaerota archaeon]MDG6965382.1 hypothetical protein [Nitrososphaerota archaeon]MDG6968785.1 hypothetical protein [Nitrososphaerota archaeon]MDG6973574.1 hypothetical protein [Nitrososphaerota archaeon]
MPKRYLLLMADRGVSEEELRALSKSLGGESGGLKVFGVDGNPRAVVVKTTVEVARRIREAGGVSGAGGSRLVPVLTSGAVGNLKRRAREAANYVQVHER